MAVSKQIAEQDKPEILSGCSGAAQRATHLIAWALLVVTLTGCQSPNSNAPMYGQSTIAPPGTANTALANPGAFAMSAPPMPNTSQPNGWAPPPVNGGAPANNWSTPSVFGSSAPPPNATAWNSSPPPNAYGTSGSIFDQAPPTQQKGIFDSFASTSAAPPGGSFNPNSMSRGYESPNSSFTSGSPSYSSKRTNTVASSGSGNWFDRLTGTQSTVPAAGSPGWNQPGPMGAPNTATAWNDPRNPSFARQPIPNPNAPPNNGWNITSSPAPYAANPLSSAPNYTGYGSPAPSSPNNIARTLPASTNPLRPTNTLPAGWGGTSAPAAPSIPATGPVAVRNLEDLPPAR